MLTSKEDLINLLQTEDNYKFEHLRQMFSLDLIITLISIYLHCLATVKQQHVVLTFQNDYLTANVYFFLAKKLHIAQHRWESNKFFLIMCCSLMLYGEFLTGESQLASFMKTFNSTQWYLIGLIVLYESKSYKKKK